MSFTPSPRRPTPRRLSPFYRDLASPISSQPRAASRLAAASAPAHPGPDPPPPPAFTLDDRAAAADFSPDPAVGDLPLASPTSGTPRRPSLSPSPSVRIRAEASGSGAAVDAASRTAEGSGWWTPVRAGALVYSEKRKGSLVNEVVEAGALLALPPPPLTKETPPLELRRDGVVDGGTEDEEWITVFGFYHRDTNLILREFEKCGVILRHFPGPIDANWMHILYQHRFDAEKALQKDGTQINSILIIGVKRTDKMQCQLLNERLSKTSRTSFMVSLPSKSPAVKMNNTSSPLEALLRPYHPKGNTKIVCDSGRRGAKASIASPARSVVSKFLDLVFGI